MFAVVVVLSVVLVVGDVGPGGGSAGQHQLLLQFPVYI